MIPSAARNPTVSIVIPTRNRAQRLRRAVLSVLTQDAEVVVVDDASTDDTSAVVASFPDDRLKYVRLGIRKGPCEARNRGVDIATGEFVLFLDDDDYLEPGAISICRSLARDHTEVDVFFHNCFYGDGSTPISPETPPARYNYEDWLDGRFDVELKPMIRRSVFQRYRFPDTGAGGEGLMWAEVIRDRCALVDGRPIIRYDTTSVDRLTSAVGLLTHAEENARIAAAWLEKFGDDARVRNPRNWVRRVLAAATYHLLSGERSKAQGFFRIVPVELLTRGEWLAFKSASLLPAPFVRLLFVVHRRQLLATLRAGRSSWRTLLSS